MTITAKALIEAKYASNPTAATEYTAPTNTRTIVDKFTATNTDSSAVTCTVHIVPFGGSANGTNKIIDGFSVTANTAKDFSELQNQILNAGDFISVLAGTANKLVIRASGREIA